MKLLDIVHPAAKTLVDIAKSQDAEVWFYYLLNWTGCINLVMLMTLQLDIGYRERV